MKANLCADEEIIVVGGGNSAGQMAVFLSGRASHVHHIVRKPGSEKTMAAAVGEGGLVVSHVHEVLGTYC